MLYSQCLSDYEFDPNPIKIQLLNAANTIFSNQNNYQKQNNLLRFRLLYPELPLPELLFSYAVIDSPYQDLQDIIKEMHESYRLDDHNTKVAQTPLSEIFKEKFRFSTPAHSITNQTSQMMIKDTIRPFLIKFENGISPEISYDFIPDYFCISTFPALFAHFSSGEYVQAGHNFIIRHINDPLAPNLVSSFLLHCSLFRDRLLTTFLNKILDDHNTLIKSIESITGDILIQIFLLAFQDCTSYFTKYHFSIVEALRALDENAAITAVCQNFLCEILNSWKYSSLLSELGLFNKKYSMPNALSYHSVFQKNMIDEMIQILIINPEIGKQILDIMKNSSNKHLEMPTIATILYTNGFNFTLTVADYTYIKLIYNSEFKNQKTGGIIDNIKDFFIDMFYIIPRVKQYINIAEIIEPKMRETSFKFTTKKKEDNKNLHVFLIERMKGMKAMEMFTSSALNVLQLKEIEYANKVLKNIKLGFEDITTQYSLSMHGSFCYSLISFCCALNNENYLASHPEYIEFLMSLLRSGKEGITGNKILEVTQKALKLIIYKEYCFTPEVIKGFSTFSEAVERMSLQLSLAIMDGAPFNYLPDYPLRKPADMTNEAFNKVQSEKIGEFVTQNSIPAKKIADIEPIQSEREGLEEIASMMQDESAMIINLVMLNDNAMKNEFDNGTKHFQIGQKLNFLLSLQELIEFSLAKTDFAQIENYMLIYDREVICHEDVLYNYFRANLFHVISVFEQFFADRTVLFPNLSPKILDQIQMLKTLFNIKFKL